MDCSLPGSSTHGIFQARVLEWGAIEQLSITHWNHVRTLSRVCPRLIKYKILEDKCDMGTSILELLR